MKLLQIGECAVGEEGGTVLLEDDGKEKYLDVPGELVTEGSAGMGKVHCVALEKKCCGDLSKFVSDRRSWDDSKEHPWPSR